MLKAEYVKQAGSNKGRDTRTQTGITENHIGDIGPNSPATPIRPNRIPDWLPRYNYMTSNHFHSLSSLSK